MDYKVLARKWRPRVFAEVVGQKPVVQALQYALQTIKLHHAYLFTGTRGVGKTTIARILAKALSCNAGILPEPCNICANCRAIDEGKYIDVLEIDAASRTKVEDTRELLDNVPYAPVQGRYKIYVIDEVHMLSNHSFNALLKTLEEPPAHVKFLFATTEPQKLPITILSRCIQFHLGVFAVNELLEYLHTILTAEKINFEPEALRKICQVADGSVRDALTLLEQVISLGQGTVNNAVIAQILGVVNHDVVIELLTAVINNDPKKVFAIIQQLKKEAVDFNKVLQEIAMLLHTIAVAQVLPNYVEEHRATNSTLISLIKQVEPAEIQLLYQIAIQGKKDLPYAPDLRLGFEMILLRMIAFQPISSHRVNSITTVGQTIQIAGNKPSSSIAAVSTSTQSINLESTVVSVDSQGAIPPNLDWAEIIYAMKLTGLTKAVAQHCIVTSWAQEKIVLTLDPIHRALLQQHHEQRLQQALQQYLGYTVQLKINIGQDVDNSTPAAQHEHNKKKDQQIAETLVKDNKNIQEILNTFNAKVEKVLIKDQT